MFKMSKPDKICLGFKQTHKPEGISQRGGEGKPEWRKETLRALMNCVVTSSVIRSPPQHWKGWAHGLGFLKSMVPQMPHSSAKVESVHHNGTFKLNHVCHSGGWGWGGMVLGRGATQATWAQEKRECRKLESDGCSLQWGSLELIFRWNYNYSTWTNWLSDKLKSK